MAIQQRFDSGLVIAHQRWIFVLFDMGVWSHYGAVALDHIRAEELHAMALPKDTKRPHLEILGVWKDETLRRMLGYPAEPWIEFDGLLDVTPGWIDLTDADGRLLRLNHDTLMSWHFLGMVSEINENLLDTDDES